MMVIRRFVVSVIVLLACAGCTSEIVGNATANRRPEFPATHIYNRQDFAGLHRDAASVARQMLAYGYADVRYASNSAPVPTAPGCTPYTEVGVYGISPDGVVWLETFADDAAIWAMLRSQTTAEVQARNLRCRR